MLSLKCLFTPLNSIWTLGLRFIEREKTKTIDQREWMVNAE